MKVFLNGKTVDVSGGITVADLVSQKGLAPEAVVIEYNHEVIRKEVWTEIVLKENDTLEILQFVGGG